MSCQCHGLGPQVAREMKDSGGESALYWYRGDQLLKHTSGATSAAPSSASSAAASSGSVLKPLPKCGPAPARRLDSRRARQTALSP